MIWKHPLDMIKGVRLRYRSINVRGVFGKIRGKCCNILYFIFVLNNSVTHAELYIAFTYFQKQSYKTENSILFVTIATLPNL